MLSSCFTKNKELAVRGENAVVDFLQNEGFSLLQKNFSVRTGEIDIIVERGKLLLFVEVKTRRRCSSSFQQGLVNAPKKHRIISAAKSYLLRKQISSSSRDIRFDVALVKVAADEKELSIDYFKNAFASA